MAPAVQVLYSFPPDSNFEISHWKSLCFPHGVQPTLLERTPSMSSLNDLLYSQNYLNSDASSFISFTKVTSAPSDDSCLSCDDATYSCLSPDEITLRALLYFLLCLAPGDNHKVRFWCALVAECTACMLLMNVCKMTMWVEARSACQLQHVLCSLETTCRCMEYAATWKRCCIAPPPC